MSFLKKVVIISFLVAGTMSLKGTYAVDKTVVTLDVDVPLTLSLDVNRNGSVTKNNVLTVNNNGNKKVRVDEIKVDSEGDWTLSDYNKDYSYSKVGLKEFGVTVEGKDISKESTKDLNIVVDKGKSVDIGYDFTIAPQSKGVAGEHIANMVIMLSLDGWSTGADMLETKHGLSLVSNGDYLYSIGGYTDTNGYVNTLESYDIQRGRWELKTPMPTKRYYIGSEVYKGKIYSIGGYTNFGPTGTVEVYDIADDSWEIKSPIPGDGKYAFATEIVDGKIYCIGGYGYGDLNTVDVYDIATDTWSTRTPMPSRRYSFASGYHNGKIYCIGGINDNGEILNTVEVYDIANDKWETKTSMPSARYDFSSGVYNGKIYTVGGYTNGTFCDNLEVYDIATDKWEVRSGMTYPRYGLGATIEGNNLYATGGSGVGDINTSVLEIYNIID